MSKSSFIKAGRRQKIAKISFEAKKLLSQARGVPFDVSPLPAVTRHDWDLLVLIRFLLRFLTSQASGAGQEAAKLGRGTRNKKVKKLSHAIAYAEITILTHSSCCTGLAL
jgi:hypothetical protein